MANHQLLLDAFAEARRTWDDLVSLQPDVVAGSGNLEDGNLVEFELRVAAHREAMDFLTDAFDTRPTDDAESPPIGISKQEVGGGRS